MGDSMGIWLIVKVMPPVQCIRGSPTRNLSRRNPGPHEGTVIPDINLLPYAHDSSSPFHAKAAAWWQSCLSGTESIGLLHVVTFGFVRIPTFPHVRQVQHTPARTRDGNGYHSRLAARKV
jgi:hypothetical protein